MSKQISFGRSKGTPWVHPADSLIRGQVIYNVKFLGHVEVDQPKGSEMVRDAIRKMKFNRQIRKAEGEKPMKVELSISIDAIRIQEPKYKVVQYQYPLHHVSYCADDKSDKRMFTFIAKEKESDKHQCFVFDSEKSAEEITLTVGQAFDLAYRKFLESSSKDIDAKKQLLILQKRVQDLTQENSTLKQRVALLEKMVESKQTAGVNGKTPVAEPIVGRRLENLILDSSSSGPMLPVFTNGAHYPISPSGGDACAVPILAPPPPVPSRSFSSTAASDPRASQNADLFGAKPFNITSPTSPSSSANFPINSPTGELRTQPGDDPFGMAAFNPSTNAPYDLDQQIQSMDRELLDLQANFSRGLSFGTEDFSLDELDPLKK